MSRNRPGGVPNLHAGVCSHLNVFRDPGEEGASVLDRIITRDESAVSIHTPTTKQQSKQWLKKGSLGPVKVKIHDTRTKTMVLTFLDSKGMVYNNYVLKGQTVNKEYVIKALQNFMRKLRKKRPEFFSAFITCYLWFSN